MSETRSRAVKAGRKTQRGAKARPAERYYHKLPRAYVVNYAATLLRQIKDHLSHVVSFTREDLLHLPVAEFEQVATITRYRATCIAVRYLIEHNELVPQKFPDLSLPGNIDRYHFNEISVASEYGSTIRRLVTNMPASKPFAVMHVVNRWRTDPQLTPDTKRKAVRVTIPRLVREGVCSRVNGFEFLVERKTQ